MNLSAEDPETASHAQRLHNRSDRVGTAIIILSTLFVGWFVLQSRPLQSANDRSRWCTVWSLVERGTYQIDEIDQVPEWSTIDKVRHRTDDSQPWHFYSSKPPLLSTAVAGLYWLERKTIGYDLRQDGPFVSRLLLLIVNVIPWCLALFSFRGSLQLVGVDRLSQWLILVAAGFGSMLSPFLTTLNNHTPAAICLVFCLSAVVHLAVSEQKRGRDFGIIGLNAALVVCFELPAALFGIISFLIVVSVDWRKTLRWYVPAAIVPLAAFFITNWICTGGIKPFYAYYGKEQYVYVHEGIPSYWSNPQGIDANSESLAVYFFHCVIGHHGLLSMTPILLLSIAGWFLLLKRDSNAKHIRLVVSVGAALSVAVLAFYLGRQQNYNYGGNSAALRWMLWLTPFWWYGMIVPVRTLSQSKSGVVVICLLLSCSVFSSVWSINRPWQPGWIYQQMFNAGLVDYRTKIPPFDPPRYSVLSAIDESIVGEWKGKSADGVLSLRIESFARQQLNDQLVIPLQIQLNKADTKQNALVLILMDSFQQGQDITTWLRSAPEAMMNADGQPSSVNSAKLLSAPGWVVDLLRGQPSSRPYNAETPRYLKYTRSTGEKWALKCDRGASRVLVDDPTYDQCWQRCDVYYSQEVPFGVAAWNITVTRQETSEVVRSESWMARQLPE